MGTIRCSTCKQFGHNYRTCQRASIRDKGKKKQSQVPLQNEAVVQNETSLTQQFVLTSQETKGSSQVPSVVADQSKEMKQGAASKRKRKTMAKK